MSGPILQTLRLMLQPLAASETVRNAMTMLKRARFFAQAP